MSSFPYTLIDLTHAVHNQIPTWTGRCNFHEEIIMDYEKGVRVMRFRCQMGTGTHMDAPTHFIEKGKNAGEIPIENLFGKAYVLHLEHKAFADFFVSEQDIYDFEKTYEKIEKDSFVLMHSGWEKYWTDVKKFRGEDKNGKIHFPGFSKEAANLLLQRKVKGIGVDTLSPDGSNTDTFPVHHLILGNGKIIIENMANLAKLPPTGAYIGIFPVKLINGSEAPVRAVGFIS